MEKTSKRSINKRNSKVNGIVKRLAKYDLPTDIAECSGLLVYGLPGSGKSTLCELLTEEGYLAVDTDDILISMCGELKADTYSNILKDEVRHVELISFLLYYLEHGYAVITNLNDEWLHSISTMYKLFIAVPSSYKVLHKRLLDAGKQDWYPNENKIRSYWYHFITKGLLKMYNNPGQKRLLLLGEYGYLSDYSNDIKAELQKQKQKDKKDN